MAVLNQRYAQLDASGRVPVRQLGHITISGTPDATFLLTDCGAFAETDGIFSDTGHYVQYRPGNLVTVAGTPDVTYLCIAANGDGSAAPTSPPNTNYWVTFDATSYYLRADRTWQTVVGGTGDGSVNCEFDGRGTYLQAGTQLDFVVDFDASITEWRLMADTSGDLVIDVWKAAFSSFPPDSGDSITASDKPTLSSASSASDTSLTGWTTSISAGDVLRLNIDSCSGISRACLVLSITRTS